MSTFVKWVPELSVPNKLRCTKLIDDESGLSIYLRSTVGEAISLQLNFETSLAYRNLDESYRGNLIQQLDTKDIFPFYQVFQSDWVEWFHSESLEILRSREIIHILVVTPDDCIDVLSEIPPKIKLI